MKKRFFVVFYLTISLLLSATLLPLTCFSALQTASAQTGAPASRSIQIPGVRERVTVARDERGIPYIEATNDSDLYFAQGYVTASDRLWQMELFRRTARGELAEIFGNAALNEDKRHRTLGFGTLADAQVATLPPKLRAVLEDYARGVNAYIASRDANNLPPEFKILQLKPRPWTVSDSIATSKLFDESLSTSWNQDITRGRFTDLPQKQHDALFPETSPLDVVIVGSDNQPGRRRRTISSLPHANESAASSINDETVRAASDDEALMERSLGRIGFYAENCAASNNWVISGRHTVTGRPLLANDPHLQASAPSIWYMVNLSAPGLHSAGVAVAGLPGVAIGHNDQIAWGVTSLEGDVQDLYVEKFDPQNPLRYMTPTGWRDAEVRHEEIKVRKGFLDTATDTVPMNVTVTRHGPIVMEQGGKRYALQWTALAPKANLL
ncbi:MAG TPA: penicillin acylase family protein, partial [Pyrinomonadaceae bacterium]|nr:penicillin acylase family protein [Pyrinomonadaceae bacterium]